MYRILEVSRLIGVSTATLRRWDKSGQLCSYRTMGNHRRYSKRQISDYLPETELNILQNVCRFEKQNYIYARVSCFQQKNVGNLDRQVNRLISYCKKEFGSKSRYKVIQEYGSGLNPERRGLWRLLRAVKEDRVAKVIIAYKDRLTRFGFPFLQEICSLYKVPIIEVEINGDDSLEGQLVTDMMSLIASFSGRLYKIRSLRAKGITPESILNKKISRIINRKVKSFVGKSVNRILRTQIYPLL